MAGRLSPERLRELEARYANIPEPTGLSLKRGARATASPPTHTSPLRRRPTKDADTRIAEMERRLAMHSAAEHHKTEHVLAEYREATQRAQTVMRGHAAHAPAANRANATTDVGTSTDVVLQLMARCKEGGLAVAQSEVERALRAAHGHGGLAMKALRAGSTKGKTNADRTAVPEAAPQHIAPLPIVHRAPAAARPDTTAARSAAGVGSEAWWSGVDEIRMRAQRLSEHYDKVELPTRLPATLLTDAHEAAKPTGQAVQQGERLSENRVRELQARYSAVHAPTGMAGSGGVAPGCAVSMPRLQARLAQLQMGLR